MDPPLLAELYVHLALSQDHLETQITNAERLEFKRRQGRDVDWFESPVKDLGLEQLEISKSGLTKLKMMVKDRRTIFP